MRRALALGVAALALAVALGFALLAGDVRRWDRALVSDDLRFQAGPPRDELWRVTVTLPFGTTRRLLGVEDDIAYRRAVALFRLGRPRERAALRPELLAVRGAAQIELRRLSQIDVDRPRRSRLANLLGVLAIAEPRDVGAERVTLLQAAAAHFQTAARLHPGNDDAKYNLELTLRRLRAERGRVGVGRLRGRFGATGAGLGRAGSGY